jgi:hypothetical protein
VGESLQPGTSAIVAVIEHKWVAELEKAMEEAGADVLTEAIAVDVAQQLEAGREVAYSAMSASGAFEATRVSVGEESIEAGGIAITDEGIVAGDIVATEDAVVGERLVATDEGAVYTIAAAVAEDEEAPEGEAEGEGEEKAE